MLNQPEPACLVIADISGYTGFLAGAELDHAQDILADLMGTVVTAFRPSFRLAKLEGDAAFVYAITATVDGPRLQDTVEGCYFAFRRRLRDIGLASIPKLLSSFVLVDLGEGRTRVEMRVARPRSAKDRAIAEQLLPMLDVSIDEGLKALRPLIEAAAAEVREAARAASEPELPSAHGRNVREPIVPAGRPG